MLTSLHCFGIHPDMHRRRREDSNRVELFVLEHVAEVVVGNAAFIDLGKALQPVRTNIAYRGYFALRVQVPLEGRAEASAYDTDARGATRAALTGQCLGRRGLCGHGRRGAS